MAYDSTTFEQEESGLKNRAQNVLQQVKECGSDTVQETVDLVRRHPGKTLAVSLVLGGVVGALLVNAMSAEEEPQASWSKLQGIGEETLEKLKDRAASVLTSVRDFIDSASAKLN